MSLQELAQPLSVEAVIAVEQTPGQFLPHAEHPAADPSINWRDKLSTLRNKGTALLALAGTLALASLHRPTVDLQQSEAPRPLPTLGIADYRLPSDMGDISVGVIIAYPRGGEQSSFGLTRENALEYTAEAEADITAATHGAVQFEKPEFYGTFEVEAGHAEAMCADPEGKSGSDAYEFQHSFANNAMAAAEKQGYDFDENAGLVIYTDFGCDSLYVRSWAYGDSKNGEGSPESEGRSVITIDPSSPWERYTVTHELGHMILKLGHSDKETCPTVGIVSFAEDCKWTEYGDPGSVMGQGSRIYFPPDRPAPEGMMLNGYELLTVGAIRRDKVGLIEEHGDYNVELAGIQTDSEGLQMIRVPRQVPVEPGGKEGKEYYWIMLSRAPRMPSNPDLCLSSVCTYPQPWNIRVYEARDGMVPGSNSVLMPLSDVAGPLAGGAGQEKIGQVIFWDQFSGVSIILEDMTADGRAILAVRYGHHVTLPEAPVVSEDGHVLTGRKG